MKRLSAKTIQRRMRAEVIEQARRCEKYAGEAQALADAGRPGSSICMKYVARMRSEAAFAAVATARQAVGGDA